MSDGECSGKNKKKTMYAAGTTGAVYGLGFIGAIIYFIQHASTFWIGILGIVKAIFWPSFLVYKLLELFKL